MRGRPGVEAVLERLELDRRPEMLEPDQLLARLLGVALLEPGLAQVLAGRRVIGLDREALVVRLEGLVVVAEPARRVADQIPRLVITLVEQHRLLAVVERPAEVLPRVLGLAVLQILVPLSHLLVGKRVALLGLLTRRGHAVDGIAAGRDVGLVGSPDRRRRGARARAHRQRRGGGEQEQDGEGQWTANAHGMASEGWVGRRLDSAAATRGATADSMPGGRSRVRG